MATCLVNAGKIGETYIEWPGFGHTGWYDGKYDKKEDAVQIRLLYPAVLRAVLHRLALGGIAVSVHGACVHQQGSVQGALPSDIRGRGACAVLSAAGVSEEADVGVLSVHVDLLRLGVFYQLVPGAALGHPLVGLQRACIQPEWQNLSAGGGGLRCGRHGAGLSAAAFIWKALRTDI